MLALVPTPLGNLRDITLRALDVLRAADLIVAEDTRVAQRLLRGLEIGPKTIWSYREQNAAAVTSGILERATTELVVLVSDAGMPGISDPGRELVAAARAAGVSIEVLPGPTAFACAAVLSGFPLERFTFEGFVSRKAGERERCFRAALATGATSIWYETPHRVLETLSTLERIDPGMRVFIARELTKRFEQQLSGTPGEVRRELGTEPRGEFVLVLAAGAVPEADAPSETDVDAEIARALAGGDTLPAIARALAARGFGTRADLYARAARRRERDSHPEPH